MARIPRTLVTGDPTAYHVMSRTALDGFPLGDFEKDFLVTLIRAKSYVAAGCTMLFSVSAIILGGGVSVGAVFDLAEVFRGGPSSTSPRNYGIDGFDIGVDAVIGYSWRSDERWEWIR